MRWSSERSRCSVTLFHTLFRWRSDIDDFFTSNLGEMIQFDKHSFHVGWFNHHLVMGSKSAHPPLDNYVGFHQWQAYPSTFWIVSCCELVNLRELVDTDTTILICVLFWVFPFCSLPYREIFPGLPNTISHVTWLEILGQQQNFYTPYVSTPFSPFLGFFKQAPPLYLVHSLL